MAKRNLTEPSYAVPVVGFRSRKAAQICTWFALKNPDGIIEKLKLIKLVYLAERRFLSDHHCPMLFDEFYSLPHGPICSTTLDAINGVIHEEIWSEYIARNGNLVVPVRKLSRDQLDEVSEAEIKTLEETWATFGNKTPSQLRNYSHDNCPEYTEISEGRIPISYKELIEALGEPAADADAVAREIQEIRKAESILAA